MWKLVLNVKMMRRGVAKKDDTNVAEVSYESAQQMPLRDSEVGNVMGLFNLKKRRKSPWDLYLIVTTSKALAPSSDALVPSSVLSVALPRGSKES